MGIDELLPLGVNQHAPGRVRAAELDDDRAPDSLVVRFRTAQAERESARPRQRRSQFVRGERLTPELGDARLRARKEQRATDTGDDCRRAPVAWNAIAGA